MSSALSKSISTSLHVSRPIHGIFGGAGIRPELLTEIGFPFPGSPESIVWRFGFLLGRRRRDPMGRRSVSLEFPFLDRLVTFWAKDVQFVFYCIVDRFGLGLGTAYGMNVSDVFFVFLFANDDPAMVADLVLLSFGQR